MKTFYHNITKGNYNETDEFDLMDNYEDGDVILVTYGGCALLEPIDPDELGEIYGRWLNQ